MVSRLRVASSWGLQERALWVVRLLWEGGAKYSALAISEGARLLFAKVWHLNVLFG